MDNNKKIFLLKKPSMTRIVTPMSLFSLSPKTNILR